MMIKKSIALILLFTICLNAKAQNTFSADSAHQMLLNLKKVNNENVRFKMLVRLGHYYLYKPGEIKSDLDSADFFLDQAKELGAKIKPSKIQNRVLLFQAEVLFERGDMPKARMAYLDVIDKYMRAGEKEAAAQVWFIIAIRLMYSSDSTGMQGLHSFENALSLYRALHNKEKEAEVIKTMGDRFLRQGKLDEAENELLKALSIYKSIGYKKLHYTYDLLAAINNMRGDFNKSIYYSLEMLKSMQATGDTLRAYYWYMRLASVYNNINDYEKSKYWYNRALINGAKTPELFFPINTSIISVMIKEGKKKEALEFLLRLIKKRPPVSDADKLAIAGSLAICFDSLGKDEFAEKYYQQAVIIAKGTLSKYNELMADKQIGDFYISRGRYGPAGIYLHKALAIRQGFPEVELLRNTYLELFKTDSATGNYFSAIKNQQRYQSLTDSIFTVAKAKQITQLQLQFEKDQEVQQLEDKGKLQQAELQHAGTVKNVTIGGIVLLLVIAGLLYRQNRLRKKSNDLLEHLLSEKEWLLKEVHHRVKNNLHTVICLLESQAAYLENDALKAIEISKHRIYAMSLIHQKLYQSEDIKMIDMDLYITEFVQYLADSFGPPANIRIRSVIEPLKLGVSQAIPLGLILNEAVTNSFKYAFPEKKAGQIFISLKQTGSLMELVIADDGIGIQHHPDENEPHTLGIGLMKGLTGDIKGNITFDNGIGTTITVIFAVDSLDNNEITGINSKRPLPAYEN